MLLAGAKSPPTVDTVISVAKQFEAYVFGSAADGIAQMENDFPEVD